GRECRTDADRRGGRPAPARRGRDPVRDRRPGSRGLRARPAPRDSAAAEVGCLRRGIAAVAGIAAAVAVADAKVALAVDAGRLCSAVPTARRHAALDVGGRAGGLGAEHDALLWSGVLVMYNTHKIN